MISALVLLVAGVAPPVPSKPIKVTMTFDLANSCEVWVEMPAPEIGVRFKKLTKEQFRKHASYIIFAEYEIKYVKVNGLEITQLRFHLPIPSKPRTEVTHECE